MRERVLAYIREHQLLKAGDRTGVAVSGGADSVALLRMLLELREELGVVLSVVHFNHGIRADADADERFVADLASRYELQFHRNGADVPGYAREHRLSLETAARKLRYDFFRSLLAGAPARQDSGNALDKIATAHTMNDQAETVLMRLIRGAGTKGLAGIYPVRALSATGASVSTAVVRPMLCVGRSEVETWLRESGQSWHQDTTNLDPRHLRNRVRHQLLPVLERDFNPGVLRVMSDLAEVARGEEAYFDEEIARSAALEKVQGQPRLLLSAMRRLPLAVQRRLIRHSGEMLGMVLEFRHVEQVLKLAESPEGRKDCELPKGWTAVRQGQEIRFAYRDRLQYGPTSYEYPLPVPGQVTVRELGSLVKAFVRNPSGDFSGYNRKQFVSPAALAAGLVVRNWRPGDRFWPAHTKAPKKLKELLQKKHIATQERALWPVVTCGKDLVWVRGFSGAATLIETDSSKQLVIEEISLSGSRLESL